jgi:tetratricopeptide (TPR) repeat protein
VQLLATFLKDFKWERFAGSKLVGLADCWSLGAFIHNSSGFFKEAVEAAANGLRVHSEHVNSLHARGYAYIQLGRYGEAESDLKKALDLTADPKKRDQIGKLLETLKVRQQPIS